MTENRDKIGGRTGEPKRWLLMRVAAVLALLAAAAIVVGLFQSPRYFAKVTMEVKNPKVRFREPQSEFLAAQFKLMRGEEILYPVIERLDLGKVFAKGTERRSPAEVHSLLLRSLDFRTIRNTELVEIGVYSSDPQLAANIANMIAIVYRENRILAEEVAMESEFARFKEYVQKHQERVEQQAGEMVKIRNQEGVLDPDPENAATPITAPNGKDGADLYLEAKKSYLLGRKILETAQAVVQTERTKPVHLSELALIREKAEPPREPVRFGFPRFW